MREEYLAQPQKPPLGATPRNILEQQRMCELSRAIHEHLNHGELHPSLKLWIDELHELISKYSANF